jgi:RNA-binding motif protein, X-linked 2
VKEIIRFYSTPHILTRISSPDASWHSDYKDTAYIYIGGLPFQLSEGDIITIFSQYGEPTFVNLVRDKETGESKGFAFLKYEDQRSTDLAVDNIGGAKIMNRILRVDHTRYKKQDEEPDKGPNLDGKGLRLKVNDYAERHQPEKGVERLISKEERELLALIDEHDDDDPMKEYLVRRKREEVAAKMRQGQDEKTKSKDRRERTYRTHHSRSHSPGERSHNSRHDRARKRSRYDSHRSLPADLEVKRTHSSKDEF